MKKVKIRLQDIPPGLIKSLKILHGLPPYDGGSNVCAGDGYFSNQIERTYSEAMISAAHKLVIAPMENDLERARKAIERKYK